MRKLQKIGIAMVAIVVLVAAGASSASAGVVAPSKIGFGGSLCDATVGGASWLPPPNPKTTVISVNSVISSNCPVGVWSVTNSTPVVVRVNDTGNTLTIDSGTIKVTTIFTTTCTVTFASPGVTLPRVGSTRRYVGHITVPSSGVSSAGSACPAAPFVLVLDLFVT